MKLKDLFKRVPPSPEALEQRKKEHEAYQLEYNKARVEAARRRGKIAGRTQQGNHGIKATLGDIGRGMGQVGDFGQQMQDNLGNMLGISPPQKKRKRK
jgi:hypothetical protein